MDWLYNSKLYKGSKYKSKINAAISNPLNKELVKQLDSYVNVKYVQKLAEEIDDLKDRQENLEDEVLDSKESPDFNSDASNKFENADEIPADSEENIEEAPEKPEDSENLAETTKVSGISIESASFVTPSQIYQATTEIPGMLNLRDDTHGALFASVKTGNTNEFWIYYDESVDLNSVLGAVNSALLASGYYFLEFNRVSRDENAIVFTIKWLSGCTDISKIQGL